MTGRESAGRLRSVVVTVGDELLLGRTVDTNGAWLAQELAALGAPVLRNVTVGDTDPAIRRALDEGLRDASVVVLSGGLGPTDDDRTRGTVAAHLERPLESDPGVLHALTERYEKRGFTELPPANRRQALVPRGAEVLPNPLGTAPGLVMRAGAGMVALLPGVPRELKTLFPEVAERIRRDFGPSLRPVHQLTVYTTGIPESVLAPRVQEALSQRPQGVEVAFLPDLTGVDIRLTVTDREEAEALCMLRETRALLTPALGGHEVPGETGDMARAVLDALEARSWMVGLGESCTGGLVARRLTDFPGASAVVAGGVVAYSNRAKSEILGVPPELIEEHGAVSREVAGALATGAAGALGARCGIGITGIAGPGGGTAAKPVGTVHIAAAVGERVVAERHVFSGDREAVRIRAAQASLALLLRAIQETS